MNISINPNYDKSHPAMLHSLMSGNPGTLAQSRRNTQTQPPDEIASREELLRTFGKTQGFGVVNRGEFSHFGRQMIALWYSPFSGRCGCYLHAYYRNPSDDHWKLKINRFFSNVCDLSVEMPSKSENLLFRNEKGKVVLKESISKVPSEH